METVLDKLGRVVLPKRVREDLGLEAGIRFRVEEDRREIRLVPLREGPELILEGGLLVFTGKATGDLTKAVQDHRSGRVKHLVSRTMR
jgi:AbrB family looped-hinge helix DNA binding protein